MNGQRIKHPLRLAILPDFREEDWPSMDFCAEMLVEHLEKRPLDRLAASRWNPTYRRRIAAIPFFGSRGSARNLDRLFNRFVTYPGFVKREAQRADFFHLCDHSYAHLLHALPSGRAGVFCHDLDTFRSILAPEREPRPRWFRAMTRRVLSGFEKAAIVFCTTEAIRAELIANNLADASKIIVAHNGIAPEFTPHGPLPGISTRYLLHVGSCIARKRIDVLLDCFAAVAKVTTDLTLLQIGGEWTPAQREQIILLGIASRIEQRRGISRGELAEYYRGTQLVLQPSEAEGFGLPIVEALASGAPVIAADIPVLREVGGDAAVYAPVGDVAKWVEVVGSILRDPSRLPERQSRLVWASRFSWAKQAETIADAYLQLAERIGI